ncbi:hypothetical protein VNO78_05690 [Psophocarpus tetragonolobus]|uniref:Uncharacterized protein n=1 Tax=Psophocarpus tetragonolobus TaxID=3891 RepID=A0AAN9SR91_PSOTE
MRQLVLVGISGPNICEIEERFTICNQGYVIYTWITVPDMSTGLSEAAEHNQTLLVQRLFELFPSKTFYVSKGSVYVSSGQDRGYPISDYGSLLEMKVVRIGNKSEIKSEAWSNKGVCRHVRVIVVGRQVSLLRSYVRDEGCLQRVLGWRWKGKRGNCGAWCCRIKLSRLSQGEALLGECKGVLMSDFKKGKSNGGICRVNEEEKKSKGEGDLVDSKCLQTVKVNIFVEVDLVQASKVEVLGGEVIAASSMRKGK